MIRRRLQRWLEDPRVVAWRELGTIVALWWALLRLLRDIREGRHRGR